MKNKTLPIEKSLPALKEALRSHVNAVLSAPPGSGKTTRVPLALLDEPWLEGRKILLLEPRRLAARASARFMARSLGEPVGETVGYRVRMETKVGPRTQVEVVTEGVLTRMLQSDPALEDVGCVIFDEFHERSLQADLGLALSLQSQGVLREDLRLLVMSATLDAEPVAELLGGASASGQAPVVVGEGQSYPVETRFLARRVEGRVEPAVVSVIREALRETEGDLLVFLPGVGEIRRVEERLREGGLEGGVVIAPLYGNLPQKEQDRAIEPSREGERKVVLSTSIAETSLTVEGVQVVIDSGLMRVPRFSPRTGMTRLETVTVSRSSADQRRGRAGRLGPGVCYRLWTEAEDRSLVPQGKPEILEADLAPLVLEMAAWGIGDPAELSWLDLPPVWACKQAQELLGQLGALDEEGKITAHGREMAELGLHPRLAHLVLKGREFGYGALACELAALLSERDILQGEQALPNVDLRLRVEALHRTGDGGRSSDAILFGHRVNMAACRRALVEAKHWKRAIGVAGEVVAHEDVEMCGLLLAFAYPDRIAQKRSTGRFLLRNGRGAALQDGQPLAKEAYLVAAELDDQGAESRMFLAAPVELSELERYVGEQIEEEEFVEWDSSVKAVKARLRKRLGALVVKDAPLQEPDPDALLEALLQGIRKEGLGLLPWSKSAKRLRARLQMMHQYEPEKWPDVSDEGLLATLEDWLAPHVYGVKNRDGLQALQLVSILEGLLSWDQRRELDELFPTHIVVPSGSRVLIDYSDPTKPVLAVRLQEMFGLQETPRIARGRVPLTLHLLSPAHRPVQVTQDLASFWSSTYFDVKKDLKGRYPKHYWPDDPLQAPPTKMIKPRL
ncbi:MAG TPA: ATP-dependent helicase HrpB [Bacilli bacterium]|nr:ATP-dependent helicase HrpB [Bacilli bacterium]